MLIPDRNFSKRERIYDWRAVMKRRIDYLYSIFKKDDLYNFKQQAVKEYENCLKQRNYISIIEK